MLVVTVILALLLTVALVGSAVGKLTKSDQVMGSMRAVGVKDSQVPVLAGIELVGALGLLVGLFVGCIGVVAALGVLVYFVLAVGSHVRANDKNLGPAAGLAVLSLVVLVLSIAS